VRSRIPDGSGDRPKITLLINDYTFPMTMEKSKHRPGPKTPGWYAYYRPKRDEEDDEEQCRGPKRRKRQKPGKSLLDLNGFEGPDCGKHKNLYLGPWRDETAKGTILAKINRSRSSWSTVPVM